MSEEEFSYDLYKRTLKIKMAFGGLVFDLQKTLELTSKQEDVVQCLMLFGIDLNFNDCKSISKVIMKLSKCFSFFDYELFRFIIRTLGSSTDKDEMKKYQNKFREYSKHRVIECPSDAFGQVEESEKVYVLKTDKILDTLTAEEMKALQYAMNKVLGLKLSRFLRVEEGLGQLTFRSFEKGDLKVTEEQQQALRNQDVLSIKYGDQLVDTSKLRKMSISGEVPKKEEPEEEESEAMEETDFSKARRALASADSAGKTKKKSAKQRKVDGHCGLPSAKVVADWDCKLNQTNIGHNNNKYYVIQLLQEATLGVMSSSSFVVFTRWGRVGEPGRQDTMHEPFATVEKAEKEFKKKFSDKTKNKWDDRHAFVPAPGKYTLLEMDEDDDGDDEILLKSDTSKLQAVCSGPKEVKYMGINAPTMEHLVTALKNKAGKKFNLADKICNCWKDIGLKLGIEPAVLDSIESNKRKDSERLCEVFDRWLNNAAGLPNSKSYPLSWQGLETLLKDCDKSEVVKQYFEFIGKMEY